MSAKTVFYVVWWVSIGFMCALLATGNGRVATPFVAFNLYCAGLAIGWRSASNRKGGDKDAKNR